MSSETSSVERPVTVTIIGWTLVAFGLAAASISARWLVFSGPIGEAGSELADELGLIAAPLQFSMAVGLGGLVAGLFLAWTAWKLLWRATVGTECDQGHHSCHDDRMAHLDDPVLVVGDRQVETQR